MNHPYSNVCPLKRRTVLAGAAGMACLPTANAMAPVLAIVLPTVLAGALSLLGIRWQLEREAQRHQKELQLGLANLQLAQAQLAQQHNAALRQERLAVLQALINHSEVAGQVFVSQNLHLLQSIAADIGTTTPSTRAMSEDIDGAGTRLGLVRGCLAVERAGQGALLDNQIALDLGDTVSAGDPLAVAVSGMQRDLNEKLAAHLKQSAAVQWQMPVEQIESRYALAGVRAYSRARQPRGNPDLQAALFVPRQKGQPVRYAYS
ncbi:MAG: hypothetical protein ABL900_08010 [Burkholderiaceae bacterium]